MPDPYFTIVIPTYNRADRITQTMATVLRQEFSDFELIVVNDGSTDNTEAVVLGFLDERIIYIKKENGERAAARNAGVLASRGAYITFLDSDDWLYPDHLMIAIEQIRSLREPEVYHQGYEVLDEKGHVLSRPLIGQGQINELLFTEGNIMSCLGVFLRKDVASSNLFNETLTLTGVEDWELWIRLAAQYPIFYHSKITAALVQHADRSVQRMNQDVLVARMNTFLDLVEANTLVQGKFEGLISILKANVMTYISLHLSESRGSKQRSFSFLLRGIRLDPRTVFRRRTLSILRNIVLR